MHRRLRPRTGLGVLVVAALVTLSANATAAPSARFVYVREAGAEDCPDESAVRSAVAARLGYEPFFPYAHATIFAEITRRGDAYVARVRLVDENNVVRGARELTHRSDRCADIVDAMALGISIAIDPNSLVGPRKEEAPQPPPAEIPAESTAAAPVEERRDEPPRPAPAPAAAVRTTTLSGALFVAGWAFAAPAASVGGIGSVVVRSGAFGVAVEARGDLPASRSAGGGKLATSFVGGTLAPCFFWNRLAFCALGTVGRLSAESRDIASPGADAALRALAGARVGLVLPLFDRLDFRANADLLLSLTEHVLQIDRQSAYVLPRFSAGLAAGLGFRFL